jgi:Zn finger protein HypA/HybF involved in hydrogenase expression
MKTYKCAVCGNDSKWSHQKVNKYCSNECASEARLLESVERAKDGSVSERSTLRKILTRLNGYVCNRCGIFEWNNEPITLQVDHIDGNSDNNSLDNLRLLCPNCHTQTHTWCGRNKKDTSRNNYLRKYKAGLAQR